MLQNGKGDTAPETGVDTGQSTGGPVQTGDNPVSTSDKPVKSADEPVKMVTAGPPDPQPSTSAADQAPVILPPG